MITFISWADRKEELRAQDARREADPDWYRRRDLLGMMLYTNAFAGTLKGVEEKLPYIQECGVNYLHLMPLLESPKGRSDGGYAVSNFRRVQPELGTMEDLDTLRDLADMIENTALCGLGKSAPKPVISTLNAFRDEYVAHIRDRRCPAGVCSKLRVYSIDPAKCKGCSKCARNCPASAIHGTLKSPYTIDQDACIRCGSCVEQCAFGAITVEK